jgi:hypothetical protein
LSSRELLSRPPGEIPAVRLAMREAAVEDAYETVGESAESRKTGAEDAYPDQRADGSRSPL